MNNGCTPTKTLAASARTAHMARRAVTLGGNFTVDMKAVKARKDKIVNQSTTGVEKWLKGTKNLTVFEGHARFESANTISIGEELLKADQFLLT